MVLSSQLSLDTDITISLDYLLIDSRCFANFCKQALGSIGVVFSALKISSDRVFLLLANFDIL